VDDTPESVISIGQEFDPLEVGPGEAIFPNDTGITTDFLFSVNTDEFRISGVESIGDNYQVKLGLIWADVYFYQPDLASSVDKLYWVTDKSDGKLRNFFFTLEGQ